MAASSSVTRSSGCPQSNEEGFNQSTRDQKRSQLQGGYECIFVEEPPKHLQTECSVCLSILKEPHLIDCDCGSSFCRTCIQPIKSEGKPCPLCNGLFTTSIPDRRLNRTLNSLQVYCSYKTSGCEWVGELGKLTQHVYLDFPVSISNSIQVDDICHFVPIDCSHCQEKFERRFVVEHETRLCPKRPFCLPCSNECGVNTKFKDFSKHLAEECPLQIIDCSFSFAGCEAKLLRKDLPAHISDSLAIHMSLQAMTHQKQLAKLETHIQELKAENAMLKEQLKKLSTHVQIVPVQFVMNDFAVKKEEGEDWTSEPFYTHPRGYKMCLSVVADGDGEGEGSYVSVFIELMRGEFDSELNWPFEGSITVTLLDQEGEQHRTDTNTFTFDSRTPEECVCQVVGKERNLGWGAVTFIAHKDLHPNYNKNDSLYFKVSDVQLTSI